MKSKIFLTFLGVAMTLSACNATSSDRSEPTPTVSSYSSKPETTPSEERSPATQSSQRPSQDNSDAQATPAAKRSSKQDTTSPKRQTLANQPSQKLNPKNSVDKTTTATQIPRESYKPISLDKIADANALVGNDPKVIARQAFRNTESERGSPEVSVDYPQSDRAVVTITQVGVADDSVHGIRYRAEFAPTSELTPTGKQWKLVWAGSQVKCQSGRGHQDWSTELCL